MLEFLVVVSLITVAFVAGAIVGIAKVKAAIKAEVQKLESESKAEALAVWARIKARL